jgi:hypothetical protein
MAGRYIDTGYGDRKMLHAYAINIVYAQTEIIILKSKYIERKITLLHSGSSSSSPWQAINMYYKYIHSATGK